MKKIISGSFLSLSGLLIIWQRRAILEALVGKTKIKLGLLLGVDRVHTALLVLTLIGIAILIIGSILIYYGIKKPPVPPNSSFRR